MMTVEPIAPGEVLTRTGRAGVFYKLNDDSGRGYVWDPVVLKMTPVDGNWRHNVGAAISGTATITAAQLLTGALIFSGGAGTQTLPTGALLGAALGARKGTVFEFTVDNTAGSGTCTLATGTNMIAGPAVVTGGATLTVANSATQGIGLFRIVFSSATAAVVFRLG